MALPEFATRLIYLLGAQPAETVNVRQPSEPEVVYRRALSVTSYVAGGTSVQTSKLDGDIYGGEARQPKKSWKTYRASQYRVAA